MIWAAILGLVNEYVADWRQGRQQKREISQAVTENKIRLAQSKESHNQAWEMAVLEGRDQVLRRVSFVLLSFPMIWAGFDPEGARAYFEQALGALPEWYVQAYLGMLAAIWGLVELRGWRK